MKQIALRFKLILIPLLILLVNSLNAQISQNIRGTVKDKDSQLPIFGVTVYLKDSLVKFIGQTDTAGNFKLNNCPIGRQKVVFTLLGYNQNAVDVLVVSGKETILNITMEENLNSLDEIVVMAEKDKTKANNEYSNISSRSFSIDDTKRYAGSIGDPSRMAANFAGVSSSNDSRNDIIIRGNSPLGLLWQLNGIAIPNPNHFGSLGSTGGPVSILNNNLLDNSDFLTGAFPAEYGNASSGVFDLKLRSGNNEKRENMFQFGVNGFELGTEGPFSKKNSGSTYLLNYRYSSLAVFNAVGLDLGTGAAIPQYQDVTFKVDVATKKAGKFTLWGIGGKSYIELINSKKDTTKKSNYGVQGFDVFYGSNMGVITLGHFIRYGNNSYGQTDLSLSGFQTLNKQDSVSTLNNNKSVDWYRNNSIQSKFTLKHVYNNKLNSKNSLRIGLIADLIRYQLHDSLLKGSAFINLRDINESTALLQAYSNLKHRFNDKVTLILGLHSQCLTLNNSWAFEPRVGFTYKLKSRHSLNYGFGMHSQMQPGLIYFSQSRLPSGTYIQTNKNLDFSKSIHNVIGWDYLISSVARIKTEIYHQYNYNIPVENTPSALSIINYGSDFSSPSIDSLVNKGKGSNIGIEFTFEKFYSKGYYFLLTTSMFDSKYETSDQVIRNTAYNSNFICNVLGGKEFNLNDRSVLFFDIKLTYAGGKRYIPIQLNQSITQGQAVYDYSKAYVNKYNDYFRSDLKVGFRQSKKRFNHEFSVEFQNITNNQNIFQEVYNPLKQRIDRQFQIGLFIVPTYRLFF